MEMDGRLIGQNIFMKAVIKADDGGEIYFSPLEIDKFITRKSLRIDMEARPG